MFCFLVTKVFEFFSIVRIIWKEGGGGGGELMGVNVRDPNVRGRRTSLVLSTEQTRRQEAEHTHSQTDG